LEWQNRSANVDFLTGISPVQIVAATAWQEVMKHRQHTLAAKPVEFVFGLEDISTRPADRAMWLTHFPNAGVQMTPDANHPITLLRKTARTTMLLLCAGFRKN
jgi:hypothetical protein